MQVIKKTIETTHVRVIIMATEDDYTDIYESEWMMAAAANPAFDFLKNSEEDIYTLTDVSNKYNGLTE